MTPLLLTTVGLINERNEILFIRRANKPFYGLFSLPGGKVESGELICEAAAREINEELGIDISDKIQPFGYKELQTPGHALVFVFTCQISSSIEFVPSVREVEETLWVKEEELTTLGELPPNHQMVAEHIFSGVKK